MQAWTMVFWYWWAIAALLLAVELLAPGFFFLWMAASAVVTGALLLLFPGMSMEIQLFLFSVLSVVSIVVFRNYLRIRPQSSDHPLLNRRNVQYVGRVFTLVEPIVNGQGKINVDDSIWAVQGDDCALPAKVRVTGVNGVVLLVEKVE